MSRIKIDGTCAVAKCEAEIEDKKQSLTFCGVGSHHQNGRAENRIKITCEPARSMLMHYMDRWREVIAQALWPHAVSLAVNVRNKSKLDTNGLSALDKISTVKHSINVKDDHAFGYPECVLQASLQDHKSIPRWDERTRVGARVSRSKQHASNVALILNLQTGHISPQFHAMFDDDFETANSLRKGTEPKRWKWLATHKRECHFDDDGNVIDGMKVWIDSELESSILFEVPKEKNPRDDETASNDDS